MKRSLTLAISLFAVSLQAAPLAIDRAALAVKGTEASFTHSFTPRGFKKAQVESGTVTFGALPMMRWSYKAPEQKLFVFDGSRSWFYVPADKQVTIADLDEQRRQELPFLFLGDPAGREKHFTVKEQRRGKIIVTTLQPRGKGAAIKSVTVTSNAATNLIESVTYVDRDGNNTAFAFSGYHPAQTTADTFRFAPPAGVQVVRAQ
jgi:outer membrane lipoprotein carrier protein